MKKKYLLPVLILSFVGVVYLGFLALGGIGFGPSVESIDETQNSDTQSDDELYGIGDEGFGDNDPSTIRPGIVIDKELLNKKIYIPTSEKDEKQVDLIIASSTAISTTTDTIATSTKIEEPIIASTTENVEISSSSIDKLDDVDQIASGTIIVQ